MALSVATRVVCLNQHKSIALFIILVSYIFSHFVSVYVQLQLLKCKQLKLVHLFQQFCHPMIV